MSELAVLLTQDGGLMEALEALEIIPIPNVVNEFRLLFSSMG